MVQYHLKKINILSTNTQDINVDGVDVTYSISYTDSRGDEKISKKGTLFISLNKLPDNFNDLTTEDKNCRIRELATQYIVNVLINKTQKSQKPKNTLEKMGYSIKTFKKIEGGDLEVIFEKVAAPKTILYVRLRPLNPVRFDKEVYHKTIIIPKDRLPETLNNENLLPIANEIFMEEKQQKKKEKSERVSNFFSEILISCGLGSCVEQVKNGDN